MQRAANPASPRRPPRRAADAARRPSPSRGGCKRYRSRDAFRARVLLTTASSPPGLTRWSMLKCRFEKLPTNPMKLRVRMDCRIKSGNDEDERQRKKEAERRQTCSANLRISRCGARAAGRARLSAFHYGSYRQGFRPLGAAPGQASWDAAGRSILNGRPNRGAKTLRSYTGVTRARLSQSRERTSRTGRSAGQHDARSCPGAECIVPRAGTALAPPSGVPSAEGVLH